MPALNFKAQFAAMVEAGEKRQTIRQTRRHPIKEGDTLYLYTGQRTRDSRKLGEASCTRVRSIIISMTDDYIFLGDDADDPLWGEEALEFVRSDGFGSVPEFVDFFKDQYGLPFAGRVIEWGPIHGN